MNNWSTVSKIFLVSLFFSNYYGCQGTDLILSSAEENKKAFNPCTDDADCEDFQNATCFNAFCQCGSSRFCEDKIQTKVTRLGEFCKIRAECNIEHAVCKDEKCKCEAGRVGSEDGRKCLRVADGLGSTCDDSIQCYTKVPRSGCQNEKCVCQQKTHAYDGACYSDIGLGEKCTKRGDCSNIPFARCSGEKCVCKEGYVASAAGKCLEIVTKMNDACLEDIQCSENFGKAICKSGSCQCEELYQFKQTKGICVRDLLLGETCEHHTDCHGIEQGDSRLECVLGECKCRSEYTEVQGYCTNSDGPCIMTPCHGSKPESQLRQCEIGRCECAEELPYCANQAAHPLPLPASTRRKGHFVMKKQPYVIEDDDYFLIGATGWRRIYYSDQEETRIAEKFSKVSSAILVTFIVSFIGMFYFSDDLVRIVLLRSRIAPLIIMFFVNYEILLADIPDGIKKTFVRASMLGYLILFFEVCARVLHYFVR